MTTIKRNQFLQTFQNKALDLSKLQGNVARQLEEAGSSAAKIAEADLNHDGKIAGTNELKQLFHHIDTFDHNGSWHSFTADNPETGQATASGKIYNTLSLMFSEIEGATATNPVDDNTLAFGQAVANGGANSIATRMGNHRRSIEETGVGLYYGDHSSMKHMSYTEKQEWISTHAKPGTNPPSTSELKESSCIGWAMENLGAAYKAAGKEARWNEIKSIVFAKGSKGTDLAKELQKDGWEGVYFNPDENHPDDGNAEHSYTAAITKRGKPYYGIRIDHRVTNYRPTYGEGTTKDMSGIERLRNVPFFFGLARGGMHTFVGRDGKVNEFHWTAQPNNPEAIEERPLEEFPWNSGVIMIPPGTWPQ